MPRSKTSKTRRQTSKKQSASNYLSKIEGDIKSNQSRVSMVLGGLIILVLGILVFNYFNKNTPSLGPAQTTQQESQIDVSVDNLPGKYTVKEGDTLFLIAEKYYKDGQSFTLIAKANNLNDVDEITTGQVLEIPKLAEVEAMASPSASPEASPTPEPSPAVEPSVDLGTGGGNTTIWGPKIEGNTYIVVEGDWLSTIAARAYGDIFSYKKIAVANNIQNPDYILPGQVLKIPR